MSVGLPRTLAPRYAYRARFVDRSGNALDEGLFLYFRAPRSFTGEDVVELHAHGSPVLLSMLQRELLRDGRARLAQPGEFTRRAFINGRVDLARAEAVADLISASGEAAARAAAARVTGALSERVRALREPLLALHAELEGELNYPEEAEPTEQVPARLRQALASARDLAAMTAHSALSRRGARVTLFGPVNAGKSTLYNALLGDGRAMVDAEPGTTRDVLESDWELEGLTVTLMDTAGMAASPGRLEALGIDRALAAVEQSDLVVLVIPPGSSAQEVDQWTQQARGRRVLQVLSKADLAPVVQLGQSGIRVSAKTGLGMDALRRALGAALFEGPSSAAAHASDHQSEALRRTVEALERAAAASAHSTTEVVSGEVGLALAALGEVTGESASELLVDAIFRRFCIGK